MRLLGLGALIACLGLFAAVAAPLVQALPDTLRWTFLTGLPEDLGRAGGVAPLLYNTLVVLVIAVLVSLLLGLPVALSLARGRAPGMRTLLDILAGTPSIVFGLLGHALFVQALGMGYSLLAGGLTLATMTLPFFVRVVEDALGQLPAEYESLAHSLGLSEARYTWVIVLPLIRPALVTGLVLSWMRAAAETAALLFTAGYSLRSTEGLGLLDSGRPLAVHLFELSMNIPDGDHMAWRAGALLMIVSLTFLIAARLLPVVATLCRSIAAWLRPSQASVRFKAAIVYKENLRL